MEIKKHPEPVLRKRTRGIGRVTGEEKELLGQMAKTMYESQGIGLAAPQIGISKRIAVVDAGEGLLKMINPAILERKGASRLEEGCLSVSGAQVEVERAEEVTVSFLDEDGNHVTKSFKGLTARAIQHEIDHINGKLIVDYLPWYKRLFK